LGAVMSRSAARMLICPLPERSVWIKSARAKRGLAEQLIPPLALQLQQPTLDGPDGSRRHLAVLGLVLGGVVADVLEQGAQVLEIQQQQALVVGHAEHDRQDPGLDVVQVQQTREEEGPHLGDRGAQGDALVARTRPKTSPDNLRRGRARNPVAECAR
jgi:hypothetical protein